MSNAPTDWFYKGKYGLLVHYLHNLQNKQEPWNQGKTSSWEACVREFNVERFSNEVAATGAAYVIFTVQQIDRFFCIPNVSYERMTGYRRGEATVHRDLIAEIYTALKKRNIKLMLYVTGDGPKDDLKASKSMNNPSIEQAKGKKFTMNEVFVTKWSQILKDISLRYKTKIAGWWVDGSYPFVGYNDRYLSILRKALKAGNQNAIVAFNSGVYPTVQYYSAQDDYLAGEMDHFTDFPANRFIKGKQWHVVSYLGTYWAKTGLKYTDKDLADYIIKCNRHGGVVSIDLCLRRDGSFDPRQLQQLKHVKAVTR